MNEAPLVSVCIITYNHAKFIRQAIDGVFNQNISFDWELIIADDCSNDGTKEILLEYQERFPRKIRLILQSKNVGAAKNWFDLITAPHSKYLAYIEGDDCWTDTYKLQKQIDFLEANPDYVLCSANAIVENLTNKPFRSQYCHFGGDKSFNQKEVLTEFYSPSLSLVFRNRIKEMPAWLYEVKSGDTFMQFLFSKFGKFYYMNFIAGIYRQHNSGISNLNSQIDWFDNNITYLRRLKGYVNIENEVYISESILKSQHHYISALISDMQYRKAVLYFCKLEQLPLSMRVKYIPSELRLLIKAFFKKMILNYIKVFLRMDGHNKKALYNGSFAQSGLGVSKFDLK